MPSEENQINVIDKLGFDCLTFRIKKEKIANLLISDLCQAVQNLTQNCEFYDYVASFDIRKPLPTREFLASIINKMQVSGVSCGVAITKSGLSTCKSASGNDWFFGNYWLETMDEKRTTNSHLLFNAK
jgi:hypothetical protein